MSPITLPRESLTEPTTWQVNGQSPANSPQAIVQFVSNVLLPMVADPQFGLDKFEIAKVVMMNSPLSNSKGIQLTEEQQKAKQVELLTATIQANPGILLGLIQQATGAGVPGAPQGGGGSVPPPPM